jgi:hypothetical protein
MESSLVVQLPEPFCDDPALGVATDGGAFEKKVARRVPVEQEQCLQGLAVHRWGGEADKPCRRAVLQLRALDVDGGIIFREGDAVPVAVHPEQVQEISTPFGFEMIPKLQEPVAPRDGKDSVFEIHQYVVPVGLRGDGGRLAAKRVA